MVSGYGRRNGLMGGLGLASLVGASLGAGLVVRDDRPRGQTEPASEPTPTHGIDLGDGHKVVITGNDGFPLDEDALAALCAERPGAMVFEIRAEDPTMRELLDRPLDVDRVLGMKDFHDLPANETRGQRRRRRQSELLDELKGLDLKSMTQAEARAAVMEVRSRYGDVINLDTPGTRPGDFEQLDAAAAKRLAKAAKRARMAGHGAA